MPTAECNPAVPYLVLGRHGNALWHPRGGVAQALPGGHRGVGHGCRGDQDPQVLDGAAQPVRLHLQGAAESHRMIQPHTHTLSDKTLKIT